MSGTKIGGQKARQTNYERHGEDFYRNIGRLGGQNGCGPDYTGGFASNRELAREAGAKGGRKSKRGKSYAEAWEKCRESVMLASKDGHQIKDIAESVGIPYKTLVRYMREYETNG